METSVSVQSTVKSINAPTKITIIIFGVFMIIVLTTMITYTYLFTKFEGIFHLSKMTLIFCCWIIVSIMYEACAIFGVIVVLQARSKKQLDYLQFFMCGVMFINILYPNILLAGTGICDPHTQPWRAFHECYLNNLQKQYVPSCEHISEIRNLVYSMSALAVLCLVLQLAVRSLWEGIVEINPYEILLEEIEEEYETESIEGFDGMIPTFDISSEEYQLRDDDTGEFNVVALEHLGAFKEELDQVHDVESTPLKSSHFNPNNPKNVSVHHKHSSSTQSKILKKLSHSALSTPTPTTSVLHQEKIGSTIPKLEPIPSNSRKPVKRDDKSKKALEILKIP